MKFTRYTSTIDEIHRAYCKATTSDKKKRNKISEEESFLYALKNDPSCIVSSFDGRKSVMEWNWLLSDRVMIFPKDIATCKSIYSGQYDVNFLQGVSPFSNEFVLNFPKDLVLDGIKPTSVLVGFFKGNEYAQTRIQPILDHLGVPDLEDYIVSDPDEELYIEIFYKGFDKSAGRWATYRYFMLWSKLSKLLQANDINGLSAKDLNGYKELDDEIRTNEDEDKFQLVLVKFVVSLMVYAQATDNRCLVDGMPSDVISSKDIDVAMKSKPIKAMQLSAISSTEPDTSQKDSHYRAWHIRQLRDARYYQNEYEDCPPGSRLVFVRDSVVNKDINPKTVIDLKTD